MSIDFWRIWTTAIRGAIVAGSLVLVFPVAGASAEALSQAEEHFLNNEPEEAVKLFEEALSEHSGDPTVYKQLASAYEQLGDYEEAYRVLDRAMEETDEGRAEFLYNKGNLAVREGETDQALTYFNEATEEDSDFAQPYRNRANLHVQAENYEDALSDYERYLSLRDDSPQKGAVEEMIAVLNDRIDEKERRKEEEERREAERARREEEARERREALRDVVRQRFEEQRSETDRSTGGEEDFESVDDDLDVLD